MAFKIIRSPLAFKKRKGILLYWKKRDSSKVYSRKLNQLFVQATEQLSKFPHIGRKTDINGVRVKIVRECLRFYSIANQRIEVLVIWDPRQDSETPLFL